MVLSLGFLTSKWPMTELHAMHTSLSCPKILPLFLTVQPDDLKPSSSRFSEWQNAWRAIAEQDPARVRVAEWEAAVKQLSINNGLVYQKDKVDEGDFIEQVVQSVSSIIRPLLRYNVSHLTGQDRLTQVVADIYERVPRASHLEARALGFYGVGGLGKTTVCKVMVNYFARCYAGRCALIEFPTASCDQNKVVAQCNKALERLVHTGDSKSPRLDDFDECLECMKKQGVPERDVFIAIDNVWGDSLHLAQRILDVGFSMGSTILVTSRSRQVLLNLLQNERCVEPLPSLNEVEACQIFAKSFLRNKCTDNDVKLEDADVNGVTKAFLFSDGYHPLAISAAGVSLGRTGGREWAAQWKSKPLSFTDSGSDTEKAIKINFDSIPNSRQNIFLDVALIYIPIMQVTANFKTWNLDFDNTGSRTQHRFSVLLLAWLSALYAGEMDTHEIRATLAYDGLLEFEDGKVHVHDLYEDFAVRKACASHRFCLSCKSTCTGMNHAQVERIVWGIDLDTSPDCFEALEYPKLQVLELQNGIAQWKVVQMPELRVMRLRTRQLKFERVGRWGQRRKVLQSWGGCSPELRWLELRLEKGYVDLRALGIDSQVISSLRNIHVLNLEGDDEFLSSVSFTDQKLVLDCLVNLWFLRLANISDIVEISGLGNLVNLERVLVCNLPSLVKVGNFESSSSLKLVVLDIEGCSKLTEVAGLSNLKSLQNLHLGKLRLARGYVDLCVLGIDSRVIFSLRHIQVLNLEDWVSSVSCADQRLGLDGLVNLRFLRLANDSDIVEISGLGSLVNLERMIVCNLPSLLKVGNFESCSSLKLVVLDIEGCPKLTEVAGLANLKSLQHLRCIGNLSAWPDVTGMAALEVLDLGFEKGANVAVCVNHKLTNLRDLSFCGACRMEEIGAVDGGVLPRLKKLAISSCSSRVLDFSRLRNLVNLENLSVVNCAALEEIEWSGFKASRTLGPVVIKDCPKLECINRDQQPIGMNYTTLKVSGCPRLTEFRGFKEEFGSSNHRYLYATGLPRTSKFFT